MKKDAAKPKPKVKPKPKPVTVTISRIARANPCIIEFTALLRKVGGRMPRTYMNARGGYQYMPSIPGRVRATASTPIPLIKLYRMKPYWARWISEFVLSPRDCARWDKELGVERERQRRQLGLPYSA